MPTDDPQGFAQELRDELDRLERSSDVDDADREAIEQWIRQRDGSVAVSTLSTYARRARLASERADVALVEMDQSEFESFVFNLRHESGFADETVRSYEDIGLIFIGDMTVAEWTDRVDRTTVTNDGPDPDDILTPADIHELTTAARHERDVAMLEFFADTGARLSLALSLRVGDVDLSTPATYTPNRDAIGLKGAPISEYPLIDSVGALRSYLRSSHPRPNDDSAALFHKIKPFRREDGDPRWQDDGGLTAQGARNQLDRIAADTDVDKRVKPHAFRHAAITRMVREGFSRSQIEHRVHWTLDTDMWSTYEHIAGEEHNEDIFRAAGVLEEETSPDQVRKLCGTCRETLAPHHEFCPNCGTPSTEDARQRVDESKGALRDELVDQTDAEMRDELRAALESIDDNPAAAGNDH